MKVVIYPSASRTIDKIAAFVESKNTPGSGKRYANRFRTAIEKIPKPNVEYALCNAAFLARLKYSCSQYNDLVIAFTIEDEIMIVHRIIHSSVLL